MVVISKVEKPDSVIVTVTITQTLGEWKKLRDQLQSGSWPACDLHTEIGSIVRKTERDIFLTAAEREQQSSGSGSE